MRAVGLVCDLRHLKFVHLSERKGVCGANALNFVILRVKNALNSGFLAFSKALSAKSVVNLACGITSQSVLLERNGEWQGTLNLAQRNTAWRGEFDNETAWQNSMAQQQNSAQRIQCGKPLQAKQRTTNSAWQACQNGLLVGETMGGDTANSAREKCGSACALCVGRKFSVRCRVAECGEFGNAQHSKFSLAGACGRSRQSKNGAVFGQGTSLSLSLSLLALFGKPLG